MWAFVSSSIGGYGKPPYSYKKYLAQRGSVTPGVILLAGSQTLLEQIIDNQKSLLTPFPIIKLLQVPEHGNGSRIHDDPAHIGSCGGQLVPEIEQD